ncbi:TolB family protein [Halobacillus salinus]|uniref:Uncharacterized protein n=1 Tax=Halobacillus salinus TaxID=192814 RepID=A0A4Z0H1H8_9BACI|nr:PD40 domain-containing protein [Halobacillus salinus]TGB03744.1 hypothetical protein E4663_01700 [Halobacillus salinus]
MKRINKKSLWFVGGVILVYILLASTGQMAAGPTGYSGLGFSPTLSDDDQTLIFPYTKHEQSSLYMKAMDGGEAELLLEPEEGYSYEEPVFAPNGTSFTFLKKELVEDVQETARVQLMVFENGSARALTGAQHTVLEADFSPDGEWIYYTMYRDGIVKQFEFHKVNLATGKGERIDHEVDFSFGSFEVLSGQKIFYKNNSEPFAFDDQLMFADLETNEQTPVVLEDSYESEAEHGPALSQPALSPDQERIAFSDVGSMNNSTYLYNIFVMNRDGSDVEQVTDVSDFAGDPTFFHKSNRILFTRDSQFGKSREQDLEYWIVDLETENMEKVYIDMPD